MALEENRQHGRKGPYWWERVLHFLLAVAMLAIWLLPVQITFRGLSATHIFGELVFLLSLGFPASAIGPLLYIYAVPILFVLNLLLTFWQARWLRVLYLICASILACLKWLIAAGLVLMAQSMSSLSPIPKFDHFTSLEFAFLADFAVVSFAWVIEILLLIVRNTWCRAHMPSIT